MIRQLTHSEIDQLLGRFMDGETTIEEEESLASYFRHTAEIPPEWDIYRQMFTWFENGMPQESIVNNKDKKPAEIINRRLLLSAAAVILLMVGLFVVNRMMQQETVPKQVAVESSGTKVATPISITSIQKDSATLSQTISTEKKVPTKIKPKAKPVVSEQIVDEMEELAQLQIDEENKFVNDEIERAFEEIQHFQDVANRYYMEAQGYHVVLNEEGGIEYVMNENLKEL